MFADCLLETSPAQRTRRGWMTLTSFGLEAAVIGLLLLIPLWRTVGMPNVARTVSTPISLGRRMPESAQPPATGRVPVTPMNAATAIFVAPGRIPANIAPPGDDAAPQPTIGDGNGIPGIGIPGGPSGLPESLINGSRAVVPVAPAPVVRVVRTSSMLEGSLIRRVQPVYPPLARTARVQGQVVLFAVIDKSGAIENLRLISGHPMLSQAAIDAVSQWRYRPYILNSEPIEVETQITVNFTLAGN